MKKTWCCCHRGDADTSANPSVAADGSGTRGGSTPSRSGVRGGTAQESEPQLLSIKFVKSSHPVRQLTPALTRVYRAAMVVLASSTNSPVVSFCSPLRFSITCTVVCGHLVSSCGKWLVRIRSLATDLAWCCVAIMDCVLHVPC
jgi:hypothetical protein